MAPSSPTDPWDEYAEGWDDDAAARAYAAGVHESLLDALSSRGLSVTEATVCDFGCGTGLLAERLADRAQSIDAVDTSPAMLARLTTKLAERGLTNVQPSKNLPASVGSHDLVVCSSVLGFVDDYPGTVVRLARLLRPTGLFVQWDWERDGDDPEAHGLSRAEIEGGLVAAGLTSVEVDTAFEIPVGDETMRPLMGVAQKS